MDDLSNIHENDKDPSGKLLEPQEKLILEQIAAGEPPHSQRAHSLLAIDAGVTHKIAALQSGQTVGQVGYWLSKFRRDRLGIFPEELLRQTGYEPPPPPQLPGQLTTSEGSEIDQDMSMEDSTRTAAEVKPEQEQAKKVKPKPDKASKKEKKEKKKAKSGKKAKTKKKAKKGKKKGKKKQVKKSKKDKKKKDKKKKDKKK